MPAAGVPAMVAVPLPLAVKVTPAGSVPVSVRVAAGEPVVVTVKLNGLAHGGRDRRGAGEGGGLAE